MQLLERQKNLRQKFQSIKTVVNQPENKNTLPNGSTPSTLSPKPLPPISVSPSKVSAYNTPQPSDVPLCSSTPKNNTVTAMNKKDKSSSDLKEPEQDKATTTKTNGATTEPKSSFEETLTKLSDSARLRMLEKYENNFNNHRYCKLLLNFKNCIHLIFSPI